MKKAIVLITLIFFVGGISLLFAADSVEPKEKSIDNMLADSGQSKVAKASNDSPQEPKWEIPEWVKRINYGIAIETHQTPRIYIETVQPLYQTMDKQHTFFTHDRISIQHERGTYSLGYGYRRLMLNENLLAGINNFFDFQDYHKRYRTGVGLELISKTVEWRSNAYFGMSKKRLISENTYERVANGGDVELGAPVPYLPWVKVFGSYYHYDFKKIKSMSGWQLRTELKPFKCIGINLVTYDDNKGKREYRMDGRLNLQFDDFTPKSIFSTLLAKEAYPDVDLKERTLDRVERNFNIQVEQWKEVGGMAIEVGRGS